MKHMTHGPYHGNEKQDYQPLSESQVGKGELVSNDVAVKKEPKGIGGWLAFFLLCLVVYAIRNIVGGINILVTDHSGSGIFGGILSLVCGVLAAVVVVLLAQKKPIGITLTYGLFVFNLAFVGLVAWAEPAKYGVELAKITGYSGAWALYFTRSVRVRNTFFPARELTPNEFEQREQTQSAAAGVADTYNPHISIH